VENSVFIPSHSWLWFLFAFVSILSFRRYIKNENFIDNREKYISLIFGFMFSFFYYSGISLDNYDTLYLKWIIFLSIISMPIAGICYVYFTRFMARIFSSTNSYNPENINIKKYFLIYAAVIFLCWLPVFLAFFPGISGYDTPGQIRQGVISGNYSTHHPLLHTLYLQFFYHKIGTYLNYRCGIMISVIIQMIFFASTISVSLCFMLTRAVSKKIVTVCLLVSSFLPFYSMLAIATTKDIIFSAFFLLFFVFISKFTQDSDANITKKSLIFFIIVSIGTYLFRNNGQYVILITLIPYAIYNFIVKKNIKLSISCIAIIALSVIINSSMIHILDAKSGSKAEMLSVPFQQLGRVYKKDLISADDKKELKSIFQRIDNNYCKFLADCIKWNAGGSKVVDEKDEFNKFIKLWTKFGAKHPIEYIEAVMLTNMGYWYIDDTSVGNVYRERDKLKDGEKNAVSGIIQTFSSRGLYIGISTRFNTLYDVYMELFHLDKYQKIPILSILMSLAFYTWLIIIAICYLIQTKNRSAIFPTITLLSMIATIIAGPCALPRYALPYIVCIPILYVISFQVNSKKVNVN